MLKVSVIIPNFNYARYLERRFNSIFNQKFDDIEIVFLDDASTDNSLEIVHKYLPDQRIKILENSINSGNPFEQWKRGISQSRGEYIWLAEADDYSDPEFLTRLVHLLDQNPSVGIAYSQSWKVDEEDNIISSWLEWTRNIDEDHWKEDYLNHGKEEIKNYLLFTNTIPNASAVLLRRSAYEKAGGVDVNFRLNGDYYLWVKMLFHADIGYIAEHLNYFRTHFRTQRTKIYKRGFNIIESYFIRDYILSKLKISEPMKETICENLFGLWFNPERNRLPIKHHLEILKIASHIDRKIYRRLGRLLISRLVNGTHI